MVDKEKPIKEIPVAAVASAQLPPGNASTAVGQRRMHNNGIIAAKGFAVRVVHH